MERIRPKPDAALAWAFRPDSETNASLHRGLVKFKRNHRKTGHVLGADRPHEGGSLAEALVQARKAEDKRRGIGKRRRRKRKMAKRVLKSKSAKRTVAPPSKKKMVSAKEESGGKMIPLKTICAELDLDPKATRVRLRRMIEKGEIDWHDHAQRWEFSPKRAKEVRAILSE